jgi:hypothetical protein
VRPYTFYLHDGVHPVPGFDFVDCADDAAAVAYAGRLLDAFGEYQFIEVFDGQSRRHRVGRRSAALAEAREAC